MNTYKIKCTFLKKNRNFFRQLSLYEGYITLIIAAQNEGDAIKTAFIMMKKNAFFIYDALIIEAKNI